MMPASCREDQGIPNNFLDKRQASSRTNIVVSSRSLMKFVSTSAHTLIKIDRLRDRLRDAVDLSIADHEWHPRHDPEADETSSPVE